MKNINNKRGFTLVELLAVIVVLAIVMGIAAVAITNVLDSTRKNAYIASAKQYIAGAKTLVNTDQVEIMMGGNGTYAPKCGATATSTTIKIEKIPTEGGEADKSPFGNSWERTESYVRIVATPNGTDCNYTYYIYLTDGVYAVGNPYTGTDYTKVTEAKEVDLDSSDIYVVE